eukprot:24582-Eustigmatos_ZCMA.PRE.1
MSEIFIEKHETVVNQDCKLFGPTGTGTCNNWRGKIPMTFEKFRKICDKWVDHQKKPEGLEMPHM